MDDESAAPQLARVRLELDWVRKQFREAHSDGCGHWIEEIGCARSGPARTSAHRAVDCPHRSPERNARHVTVRWGRSAGAFERRRLGLAMCRYGGPFWVSGTE